MIYLLLLNIPTAEDATRKTGHRLLLLDPKNELQP